MSAFYTRYTKSGGVLCYTVRLSVRPSPVGTLCSQLCLQFYADLFETFQMFLSWSEAVHGLDIILRLSFVTFPHFQLSYFSGSNTTKCIDSGYRVCATPPTDFMPLRKRLHIRSVISVNYHYVTVLCPFNLLIRFKCYNTV